MFQSFYKIIELTHVTMFPSYIHVKCGILYLNYHFYYINYKITLYNLIKLRRSIYKSPVLDIKT